jgi:pimeloyl-ACP methyl ester carboxylesterase
VRTLRALFSTEIVNRISGVGFTTPTVQVFNSSVERSAWELQEQDDPLYLENPDAFARRYTRWSVFGDLATQRTRMAAEHVSTAAVARDMLEITRAFGFDKLKYWGTSYGTMIGTTFAAMFSDHVERLVLESVCLPHHFDRGLTVIQRCR